MSVQIIRAVPDRRSTDQSAAQPVDRLADRNPARARVPLDAGRLLEKGIARIAQRIYGEVLDPLKVAFHHRGVLASMLAAEASASRWRRLPVTLQALAMTAVAAEIGCSWCLDFGYREHRHQGVDPAVLRAIGSWRTSEVYSPLERSVIEYAVRATATPPTVDDELVRRLREDLTDAQIVELTALVSLENSRSRTNAALGLRSQGFSDDCEIPAP